MHSARNRCRPGKIGSRHRKGNRHRQGHGSPARKETTVTNVTVDKRTQHKGPERDGEFLPGPLTLRSSAWTGLGAVIPNETPASRIRPECESGGENEARFWCLNPAARRAQGRCVVGAIGKISRRRPAKLAVPRRLQRRRKASGDSLRTRMGEAGAAVEIKAGRQLRGP